MYKLLLIKKDKFKRKYYLFFIKIKNVKLKDKIRSYCVLFDYLYFV